MAEPVPDIVRRALALIRVHQPAAYSELALALDGLEVSIDVEGALRLRGRAGAVEELAAGETRAALRLEAKRAAIQDLVAGRETLTRSIRSGRIGVAGSIEALGRGVRAFEYFAGALLRIEEAGQLRQELMR